MQCVNRLFLPLVHLLVRAYGGFLDIRGLQYILFASFFNMYKSTCSS